MQKLTSKSNKKESDFYIINAQNVEKMGRDFFNDIGLVIVDEAHLIMAERLSKSLQYVHPRYLIGLTATPYRPDGLNLLLDFYFGPDKIIRKLFRDHLVYKVDTGFKPPIEYTTNNKVNWGALLDTQANNEERNNQEFDKNARILIGTNSKVGTGFDHKKLDALLLAADVEEYFIQYLGRVFRTQDGIPLIIDLIDKNNILNKHWLTRKGVYKEHGGTINNFDLSILKNL